jgi:hypothetical protein
LVLLRASGRLSIFGSLSALRGVLGFLFTPVLGWKFGYTGAVFGEVLATCGALWVALGSFKKLTTGVSFTNIFNAKSAVASSTRSGGKWLMSAFALGSIPLYLDRTIVGNVFGEDTLGTYSFLATFIVAANALAGLMVQRLGTEIIKWHHHHPFGKLPKRILGKPILAFHAAWTVAFAFACICMVSTTIFARYELDYGIIAGFWFYGATQVTNAFDYLQISLDKEVKVFYTTLAGLFFSAFLTSSGMYFRRNIAMVPLCLGFANVLQSTTQIYLYYCKSNRENINESLDD